MWGPDARTSSLSGLLRGSLAVASSSRSRYTHAVSETLEEPPVESWLLEILVCPESKARLVKEGDWLYSTDARTRRRYAIRESIPNLLIEESEVVSPEDFERVMSQHKEKMTRS